MSSQIQSLQQFASDALNIPPASTKPQVRLPGNGVQISDTASTLYELAAAHEGLFYSNGTVVKLVQDGGASLPKLVALSPAAAMTEFEKYARFVRPMKKEGEFKEYILNESMAKAILASHIARQKLAVVKGLLNRPLPVLRAGRVELLKAGYNDSEGLLVADGTIQEPETLEEAVRTIEGVLVDFSFRTEPDKSRAVACLLTPALKIGGFITEDTPLHIIEAEESQTGKGFFLSMRDALYGEKSVLIAKSSGGVGSLDETLGTALFGGRPFIQLDNLRGKLDSSLLESYLTNPGELMVRIPFSQAKALDGSFRFVSITSNGLETTEDLTNRASFIRLVKEKGRVFTMVDGKSIPQLIQAAQPKFMGAITKIIRHYRSQGMPRTEERRHARVEWAQRLDWIVQNIFDLEPLMDGHEVVQKRSNTKDLSFVRSVAIQVEKSNLMGAKLKAQEIANLCQTGDIEIPGLDKKGDEGYTDRQGAQQVGSLMGKAFGPHNTLEVDGFTVTRSDTSSVAESGNIFRTKAYEFQRAGESAVTPGDHVEPPET